MLNKVAEDPKLIRHINTDDEMWFYKYDVEIIKPCSEWQSKNEPVPKTLISAESTEGHLSISLSPIMSV